MITALSAQFASDPLGSIAAIVAIIAGIIASVSGVMRIIKDCRR